jgi:DNA-binding beta-propeller fold protein YncE
VIATLSEPKKYGAARGIPMSQVVSFHDPLDLTEVGRVNTGSSPDGLLAVANQMMIAESGANTVSVYDFGSNRIQSRLTTGFSPRRILEAADKIYISNYDEGSISVVFPGQFSAARTISGMGLPLEMVFNPSYQRLYVSDEEAAGLAVIDTVTDRLTGFIDLGARPMGLAIQ